MYNKYYYIHILRFISRIITKIKLPCILCRKFNHYYHCKVWYDLIPLFKEVQYDICTTSSKFVGKFNNIIWVFWWQGKQHMPPIVRICVESIKRNSSNYKVILITKNNVKKYSNIPNYIYLKLLNKYITLTHFSDILRFNLLYNHGGIWMDATIYCTSTIPKLYEPLYTSGGYSNKYHAFVSSKWTGFLIGGYKGNPIFLFMAKFFDKYWYYNIKLIDYFLIDYGLDFIYKKNIGNFRYYVDNVSYKNNPHLYDLQSLLNQKYNSRVIKKITSNTNLFKLTYKMKFKSGDTFYKRLIRNNLNKY